MLSMFPWEEVQNSRVLVAREHRGHLELRAVKNCTVCVRHAGDLDYYLHPCVAGVTEGLLDE